jgi:ParB-like chromosome segregation protein Spo0J
MENWRHDLSVHPAADLFPLMSEAELRELGEDIKKNGLQSPIIVMSGRIDDDGEEIQQWYLLDGRNRLDAMALVGIKLEFTSVGLIVTNDVTLVSQKDDRFGREVGAYHASREVETDDPYSYVVSANLHRRHLTLEQKRELIAKLLKAKPEASDRQIGAMAKADGKTVAKIRGELEGRAEIPHDEKRTDSKGRKQPATKPKAANKTKPEQKPRIESQGIISVDDRKAEMAALDGDDATANNPNAEPQPEQESYSDLVDRLTEFRSTIWLFCNDASNWPPMSKNTAKRRDDAISRLMSAFGDLKNVAIYGARKAEKNAEDSTA